MLEIGCGWGFLSRVLAKKVPGCRVTGITLSKQQLNYAITAAAKEVLRGRYRKEPGVLPLFRRACPTAVSTDSSTIASLAPRKTRRVTPA